MYRTAGRSIFFVGMLVALAACGGGNTNESAIADPPQNVIIVLVDALRADKLGCYGSTAELTPEIDALAETGLLFSAAYSNATFTFPSTASLFTSTQPPVHRVTHDPDREEII